MIAGVSAGAFLGALLSVATTSKAQQASRPAPTSAAVQKLATGEVPSGAVDTARTKLRTIEDGLHAADADRRKLEADIESLRGDRVRLSAALIDATARIQATEAKVASTEERMRTLAGSEEAIRHSLESRRAVIGEVLAALERMGRKPLPAILVRPEDMLLAIRTSMLLGAVVPELKGEIEALASDLGELTRVRRSIVEDRDILSQELAGLRGDQERLGALVDARQTAQTQAEGTLEAQQARAAELAREATSLRDLIGRAEGEAVPSAGLAGDTKVAGRLAPAVAFASARGSLAFPASGAVVKAFGANDGFGSTEHGVSFATRPQAVVSTPADGWVSFSGPYRSYGQLLIINTGDGYYIVLAGMARTTVAPGQFVLAGEPVGIMGDGSVRTAASVALGAAQPILYVEFRKDGAAIDPSPWWAKGELEKVRG